jgi:hypothetical protein
MSMVAGATGAPKEKGNTDLPRLPPSKNISKTSNEKRQTKLSTTQIYKKSRE